MSAEVPRMKLKPLVGCAMFVAFGTMGVACAVDPGADEEEPTDTAASGEALSTFNCASHTATAYVNDSPSTIKRRDHRRPRGAQNHRERVLRDGQGGAEGRRAAPHRERLPHHVGAEISLSLLHELLVQRL